MINHRRIVLAITITVLLVVSTASYSWAWRGGGWRGGGWHGGVGVYVGGPWWGYDPFYNPYYYDPYYPYVYPAPYYYPYAVAVPQAPLAISAPQGTQASSDDDSRHDLKFLNDQIAQARAQVDYEYDDGDISQTEHGTELNRLSQIAKEASAQAKAGGGTLTRDQENSFLRELNGQPSSAQAAQTNMEPARVPDNLREESESSRDNIRRDLNTVNDEMKRLRVLLDKKLEDGDITKAQRTRMSNHLDLIDKEIQSSASVNGGSLTLDQETTILRQLQRASDSIEKNFVVD